MKWGLFSFNAKKTRENEDYYGHEESTGEFFYRNHSFVSFHSELIFIRYSTMESQEESTWEIINKLQPQ